MGYVDSIYPLIGFLVLSLISGLGLFVYSLIEKNRKPENEEPAEVKEVPKEYHCPHCAHDISQGVGALVKRFAYGGVKKLVLCPRCDAKIVVDLNMVETNIILKDPGKSPERLAAEEQQFKKAAGDDSGGSAV